MTLTDLMRMKYFSFEFLYSFNDRNVRVREMTGCYCNEVELFKMLNVLSKIFVTNLEFGYLIIKMYILYNTVKSYESF